MTLRDKGVRSPGPAELLELELSSVQTLSESLNTPRSLTVSLMIRYGEFNQLVDLVCDPDDYTEKDVEKFASDHLITEILKKNPRIPLGVNRAHVATRKWVTAERSLRAVNDRLEGVIDGSRETPPGTWKILQSARSIISKILGPLDRRTLSRVEHSMRFGPGATSHLSGDVRKSKKYSSRTYGTTPDLVDFRAFCFPQMWRETCSELEIVLGSRYTTVPKNAKTDRAICIEPDLNIYVQLGIGAVIRERLLAFGLDLSDQTRNQALASRAWLEKLCTMDLSMASDLVALNAPQLLLPKRWWELLALARCTYTKVKGQTVKLSKFSSMGNGYTFELETLIFLGVVLACLGVDYLPEEVGVYGDDLIFPSWAMSDVTSTLDFLGFRVNEKKTFGKGLFFESCGTDWFCGVNVRPFYLRAFDGSEENDGEFDFTTACYLAANAATRYAHSLSGGAYRDIRFLPFWIRWFTAVRRRDRFRIPQGFGDASGFVTCREFDPGGPRSPWGARFLYRKRAAVKGRKLSQIGGYLAALDGAVRCFTFSSLNPSDFGEDMRGRFKPAVTRKGRAYAWPLLGPWL